jgi:hypothetical protein
MKKSLLLLAFLCSITIAFAGPPISEKVIKNFTTSFPGASEVVWTEFDNFYQVYFVKDKVQCRMYYDFNGNIIKSRRDFSGDKLNPFLTAKLQKKFPDKTIFVVNEFSSEAETFYLVHLEGKKDWLEVRCSPTGEMSIVNKLQKE